MLGLSLCRPLASSLTNPPEVGVAWGAQGPGPASLVAEVGGDAGQAGGAVQSDGGRGAVRTGQVWWCSVAGSRDQGAALLWAAHLAAAHPPTHVAAQHPVGVGACWVVSQVTG